MFNLWLWEANSKWWEGVRREMVGWQVENDISSLMAKKFKSLKGKLLLDGGKLEGSYFHRSVVLICQHDAEGAFGLVLNRRAEATVGEALSGQVPESLKLRPLHLGGPVQPQVLTYLHSSHLLLNANVMPQLNLGHDLDELVELADQPGAEEQKLLVFAGYAGWGAGQLDDEMGREAWLTHGAALSHVFHPHPDQLWKKIVRMKGLPYRLMAEGPDDLSVN